MTEQLSLDSLSETQAICELVFGDPMHQLERDAVIDAIRSYAAAHGGLVDVNGVRPLIPRWVYPRVVSATYGALRARKLLVRTGEWTESDDRKGRNVGKPQRIYRWMGE